MFELQKVRTAGFESYRFFGRRFSRDLKTMFELAKVRIAQVRIRQSWLYLVQAAATNGV